MTENYSVKMLSGATNPKRREGLQLWVQPPPPLMEGAKLESVDVAELIFSLAQAKVRVGLGVVA